MSKIFHKLSSNVLSIHEMVFESPVSVRAYSTEHLSLGHSDIVFEERKGTKDYECVYIFGSQTSYK